MGRLRLTVLVAALLALAAVLAAPALARSPGSSGPAGMPGTGNTGTGAYAPLKRQGPALDVPQAQLAAALACTAGVSGATRNPILLVPGTNLDPKSNFSWNYERALSALGWPYCTIALPSDGMDDIQVAGEYLVYALRTVAAISGRRVDVLGYSQGGMVPRWALRFWPDTRKLVRTLVGLDPSNHGTLDSQALCQASCPPSYWQQAAFAKFLQALNSGAETFSGVFYTVIFSRTDEVVVPNFDASSSTLGSSSLHTGTGWIENVAVQQVCPTDVSDHLAMGSYDPVGFSLAMDAFAHESTANPADVPISVCTQPFQPGVDPATFPTDYAGMLETIGQAAAASPQTPSEPPLRCYVFAAGCP